jgi:pimeloyl-ACP methyl ester carboxylesterase
VLAVDARGHGASDKPYDAAAYGEQRMARDLLSLCDHLGLERFDLVGYSMGAVVALIVASTTARARRLVAAGVGEGVIECGGVDMRKTSRETMAAALLTDDPATIAHPGAAVFRAFVDRSGSDRRAPGGPGAAPARGNRSRSTASRRATLVLAGAGDRISLKPAAAGRRDPRSRLPDACPATT